MKIVVIGGGAAGFFAAINCAKNYPDSQVTILEAGKQCLSKVRISGGGRCNVTHACFEPALLVQNYPRGAKALLGAFSRFQPLDTVAWFSDRGVNLKTEADGRMFPVTDDSSTIVNCLIRTAENAGVKIYTGILIVKVSVNPAFAKGESKSKFLIKVKTGEWLECDRILIATGSNPIGYQIAKSFGHRIESPVPSLFTFTISDPRLAGLSGVAVPHANVRLLNTKLEQTGPVLITHWGLSGPAILKLSAWGARVLYDCNYQTKLVINWLPQYTLEVLHQQLVAVKSQLSRRAIANSCPVSIPQSLWKQLIAVVGIGTETRWAEISNKVLNQLIQELTQGEFLIKGKGVFKEEFVTCGGINLKEVDFKTMESRLCPGLYFAGEILDIDGVTGGFNFQSAWTTGAIAG